jgi:formate hydrogenlyase transcriptional activator
MLDARIAQTNEALDETNRDDNSPVRLLILGLTAGGAYYVGALIGFALTFPDDAVSTLWPPNAILLASLLLTPTRRWWVILVGVLPAHFAVQLQTGVPLLMILCWFISNSAEALIGAFCVRYFIHPPLKFDSFHHVGIFTTFAVILSPFVTSFLDAGFVVLNQWRQVDFWEIWKMRVSANVLAALTLAPAIVLWIRNGIPGLRSASLFRTVEVCALISGLLSSAFLVFSWQSGGPSALPVLVYMPLPFLLWGAVRFGPLGSSTCVLIWALLSIWETLHGSGAFISGSPEENVFFLQLFLIVVSMPLFFLAALVEERRSAERTRAQAAAIVESSNDAIIGCTLNGVITTWNRGAVDLYGYSAEEAVGQPVAMLIPSRRGDPVTRVAEKIKRGEGVQSFEAIRIAKGGRRIDVSITVSPVVDTSGKVVGLSSIARDITARKRVEEALRESEKHLARTEEFSLVMVTHTDLGGRWLKVPPTLCKLLGYTEAELLGRRFQELTHPDDVDADERQRSRLLRGEIKSFDIEKRYLRKDGGIVWVSVNVSVVTDAKDNPIHCLSYIRDITERKRAEQELKEALSEVKRLKEQLEAENVYLRSEVSGVHRYGEMIGESEGIKKIFEQVDRIAPTDMTVLILGETGTGKELVARLVHEKSGRRDRPLVKVNCSTLPAELIESELFGHEKGAFTGAVARQVGRFELADGGTIFLDEVGELPLMLQAKLLRVLQEGEFERLGSGKTIKVDVRVIAATNRNLSEAAQRGRFRTDLYYRLNVYPIEVPPLRERRGDIELMAEAFLHEAGQRLGKGFGKISNEMIEALQAYNWPGNVRELENVISRAAVVSKDASALLLPEGWNKTAGTKVSSESSKIAPEPFMLQRERPESVPTLAQFERTRILEVLHQTNWRIEGPKGAAVILGLHPNTLRSRLHKQGISKPRNYEIK